MEMNLEQLQTMQPIERVLFLVEKDVDEKILRAMVCALSDTDKASLRTQEHPFVITRMLESLDWEDAQPIGYEIKPQPKYRPVDELLKDFNGTGKKQAARKELQVRLPYLTAYEQKQVIYTFLDTEVKTDRMFVLKYLDKHFDPMYLKAVEVVWGLYHDFEAAKVLTHYAPVDFILENQEQLAQDYRYFPVRLRLPADTPVNRAELQANEYIHLCARQHLPISESETVCILVETLWLSLKEQVMFLKNFDLMRLRYISAIVWAIGKLGYSDVLSKFYVLNEKTKPVFNSGEDIDTIRNNVLKEIELTFDYYMLDVDMTGEKPLFSHGAEILNL